MHVSLHVSLHVALHVAPHVPGAQPAAIARLDVTPAAAPLQAHGVPPWREALLLVLWLLATAWVRPLLLPDEGRYAGVAFEMLHGSALLPTLDGLPFFHKPPLLYWSDIAAMQLFGVGAFAVRVGPALMAWAMGLALFLHLRRGHGVGTARIGLLVLATSPLYFVGAQYVNHDIGVAACISLAVLAAVRALEVPASPTSPTSPRSPADRWQPWMLLAWLFCGLGVLAKGLIGIVLPALIVLPWLAAQQRWRDLLRLLHPPGILLAALVVLPWMWAMQSRYPGFFDYFIVEQHFRRYAGASFNNQQPFWFFAVVLPILMLPWTLWLWPALRQRGRQASLYLWWLAVVVGFFSLPSSKLVGYVMPALVPLAALLALAMNSPGRPWRQVAGGAAVWCLLLIGLLAWKAPGSHRDVGLALAQRLQPGERVVFVDQYFYDVPFYARLQQPAVVVSQWDDPDIAQHDNWRKELLDAARFDRAAAARTLWPWAHIAGLACGAKATWWMVTADTLPRLQQAVPGAAVVQVGRHALLLRSPARGCPSAAP